jgi:hypothetical protein
VGAGDEQLASVGVGGELNILANQVSIEMRDDYLALPRHRIEPQRRLGREHEDVPDNLPFDVRQESFAPLAGQQAFDVVRAEAVQKLGPVRAGQLNLCTVTQIEDQN